MKHPEGRPLHGQGSWHLSRALLPSGWASDVRISFANGHIVEVEAGQAWRAGDHRAGVGIPGVPNLHSHGFQRAMSGLTEVSGGGNDSFWTWRDVMYRFIDTLTPDAVEAITALAYMEMLESGFTRVGEFHYLHHDLDGGAFSDPAEMGARIVQAATATGIGLTLLPVFYAHSGFGGLPPTAGQRRFVTDPERYHRLVEECRGAARACEGAIVGVAPHSLRAVTPDELSAILPAADGGPVHIHIAEQTAEVDACIGWSGVRPVEWLLANAPVDSRWCLVHATHIVPAEAQGMVDRGAVAGLCPITEANLGDGLFPAAAYLQAGGLIGVGSDSNVRIDMTEELRLLEYGQRLSLRFRNVLASETRRSTGRALYDAVVTGGAQALGVRGGLAVGAPADMLIIDPNHDLLAGRSEDSWIDTLLFGGARGLIAEVWAGGVRHVEGGRHWDRDRIERAYAHAIRRALDF